jgi:flagellar export protein FliJ
MKAFKFTLEAVRALRQRQEQKALEQYAQMLSARQQAIARLETVNQELNAVWRELRGKFEHGCAAAEAAQANDFQQSLIRRRDECAVALGTAERRVNAALQQMLAARQQREMVDKFFEKQKSAHQRDQLRNEQKLLDDLAGRRANPLFAWNSNPLSS